MAVALFDLDGTLLPHPGAERRFLRRLVATGHVTPGRLAACALAIARQKLSGDRWALQRNKDYLAGLDIEEIALHARRYVADELVRRLRPAVIAEARYHAARGDTVVLLSGAPEFLARPFAEALGIEEVWATRCASLNGRFAAGPALRHPFGPAKCRLARDVAERHGVDLASCTAYGDSRHDIELLAAVAVAVAVHPDRHLRAVALKNGWRVLEDEGGHAPRAVTIAKPAP